MAKRRKRKVKKDDLQKFFDYNIYPPTRTIYIGGEEVDNNLAEKIIKAVHILDLSGKEPINIIINNPGGDEYQGFAIYGVLRNTRCKVIAYVLGQAMSMASVILQAADKRILNSLATIMIHDGTWAYEGDAKNAEKWGEESKRIRELMYKIYHNRMREVSPRITIKNVEDMCKNDNIIIAKEAIKLGLADEIMYERNFVRRKKNGGKK